MSRIKVDMGRPIPKLHDFDKEIERFAKMMTELSGLKTPVTIHWLRINAEPVKLELVKYAGKWHEKYSNYLKTYTEERIMEVHNYLEKLKEGLGSKSPLDFPNDERLLYSVMTHIRDVKLSTNAIRKLFHPIRDLCHLLKKHHVVHDGLLELEQAPSKWEEVIRLAYDEKEKILPLQNEESIKIRNKVDDLARRSKASGRRSRGSARSTLRTPRIVNSTRATMLSPSTTIR
jgi:dynein heavy chain